ncbi:50S ribosomal protein L29 [Holospora obtusa F1]|uniref:Large ribosomal subunit protein uL29 n=1 Tax=Holospora obtusa F1 TaxID=1399147 RepID=W6TGY5_HOLOB|nr:50S ribosomal protein L29 [Holospora obtusa]ETZ07200.1 50S ribosomal protein L29 [Holospora obtusa F1]
MKSKQYLMSLASMSDKELFDELLELLKQKANFSFSRKKPQSEISSHRIRLLRRNVARLKMVMRQRKKEN